MATTNVLLYVEGFNSIAIHDLVADDCLTLWITSKRQWPGTHFHAALTNFLFSPKKKENPQHQGFKRHAKDRKSFRRCSGLEKNKKQNLSQLKIKSVTISSEYLLWSPLAPPTRHHTPHSWTCPCKAPPSPLSLSPNSKSHLCPQAPPPPPPFIRLTRSPCPVGGVMSGFCGGLLLTGPDNQRVCKCQFCVWLFKLFVYGQGFKRQIFLW